MMLEVQTENLRILFSFISEAVYSAFNISGIGPLTQSRGQCGKSLSTDEDEHWSSLVCRVSAQTGAFTVHI